MASVSYTHLDVYKRQNVRSEPFSVVKSAGVAPGTRALVPGVLIDNYMAKIVCLHDYLEDIIQRRSEEWRTRCSVMVQMPTAVSYTHLWDVFVGNTMKRTIFVSKNGFIKYSGRPAA